MSTELSTKEIWLDISGYEGYYQVSNLGNVKSVERKVPHERKGFEFIKSSLLQYAVRVIFCLRNFFVFFYPFDCELICVNLCNLW